MLGGLRAKVNRYRDGSPTGLLCFYIELERASSDKRTRLAGGRCILMNENERCAAVDRHEQKTKRRYSSFYKSYTRSKTPGKNYAVFVVR